MKRSLVLLAFLILCLPVLASGKGMVKFWVFLADKDGVEFNPHEYFSSKTIEKRKRKGIPLDQLSDRPLKASYVKRISLIVDSIAGRSRWFNALACYGNEATVAEVRELPFVESVRMMNSRSRVTQLDASDFDTTLSDENWEILRAQTNSMGKKDFREHDIDGSGVRIAVFDAGFPTVDQNPAFEHIREDDRIIATHDFVQGDSDVYAHGSHGTMVFSNIAGRMNGEDIGMATGAEFLLARTERTYLEPFSEEENWLEAVEWADKNGADIINSSLGYTHHRYFTEDMDGKTSLVSDAGNMAARKGMLVVNAAGNSGTNDWKVIGTPADADSVLSVGGISPWTGRHTSFSSYGPTEDKRMKPNVCAYGHVIASGPDGFTLTQGTSFASPLTAGFAACALQTDPELSTMELFKKVERSGHLYPYFDYAHGFGVPQAGYFFKEEPEQQEATFTLNKKENQLELKVRPPFFPEKQKDSSSTDTSSNEDLGKKEYLYYHLENDKGYLDKYYVVKVKKQTPLKLDLEQIGSPETIRFHYKGYTETYKINSGS